MRHQTFNNIIEYGQVSLYVSLGYLFLGYLSIVVRSYIKVDYEKEEDIRRAELKRKIVLFLAIVLFVLSAITIIPFIIYKTLPYWINWKI